MAAAAGELPLYFRKCFICNSTFESPRVLPCMHVFCQGCLESYWRLDTAPDSGIDSGSTGSSLVSGAATSGSCRVSYEVIAESRPTRNGEKSEDSISQCALGHDNLTTVGRRNNQSEAEGDAGNINPYCEADPEFNDDVIDAYAVSGDLQITLVKDSDKLSEETISESEFQDCDKSKKSRSFKQKMNATVTKFTDTFTKERKLRKRLISAPKLQGSLPDKYRNLIPAGPVLADESAAQNETPSTHYIPMEGKNKSEPAYDIPYSQGKAISEKQQSASLSQPNNQTPEVEGTHPTSLTSAEGTTAEKSEDTTSGATASEECKEPNTTEKRKSFLFSNAKLINSIQNQIEAKANAVTSLTSHSTKEDLINRPLPAPPGEYETPDGQSALNHLYEEPDTLLKNHVRQNMNTDGYLEPEKVSQRPVPKLREAEPLFEQRTFDHTIENNRKLQELLRRRHTKTTPSMTEGSAQYEHINAPQRDNLSHATANAQTGYSQPRDLEKEWKEQHPLSPLKHKTMFLNPDEVECPICQSAFTLPVQHQVSSLPKCPYVEQKPVSIAKDIRSCAKSDESKTQQVFCHLHAKRTAVVFCTTCFQWLCEHCPHVHHKRHELHNIWVLKDRSSSFLRSYSKKTEQFQQIYQAENFILAQQAEVYEREKNEQLSVLATAFEQVNRSLFEAYTTHRENLEEYYNQEKAKLRTLVQKNEKVVKTLHDVNDMLTYVCKSENPQNVHELSSQVTDNLLYLAQKEPAKTDRKNCFTFQTPEAYPSPDTLSKFLGSIAMATELKTEQSASIPNIAHRKPDFKVTPLNHRSFSVKLDTDKKGCIPNAIAVNQKGDVMILDDINQKVKIFTVTGRLVSQIATQSNAGFIGPWDIVAINETTFAVSDRESKCVFLLNSDGQIKETIANGLGSAWGLFFCSRRGLFVTDPVNHVVSLFSQDGDIKHQFKAPDQRMKFPQCIAVDVNGDLVISDFEDRSLHIFRSTGQYLARIAPKLFDEPSTYSGLAYRQNGDILAVDVDHSCVMQFDQNGDYLWTVLTKEDGLKKPQAITINKEGNLLVLDGSFVKAFDIYEPRPIQLRTKSAFRKLNESKEKARVNAGSTRTGSDSEPAACPTKSVKVPRASEPRRVTQENIRQKKEKEERRGNRDDGARGDKDSRFSPVVTEERTSQKGQSPVAKIGVEHVLSLRERKQILFDTKKDETKPNRQSPVSLGTGSLRVKPVIKTKPDTILLELRAAGNTQLSDFSKPASVSAPRDISKPASVSAPRDISKPASVSAPRDISKPASVSAPRDISKPASVSAPRDISKPASVSAPRDISKPTSVSAPRDISKPASVSAPRDISKPASGSAPRDISKPASVSAPRDISKPASVSAPRDTRKASFRTPFGKGGRKWKTP